MAVELIPIKPGQHSVVLVPRATTDLPFFYLTKQKNTLTQNIDYRGVDGLGRPIRWQVFPNTNPAIGAPAIDAHETWMRLVKPSFDARINQAEGEEISIVPLGKIRECLRAVDWGQGGWEARRLLKALHQIGAASCIADLWIPTTEIDAAGNPIFKRINATFSKLTIYAIGATHVTEEQLNSGNFNFDFELEDTLYVQLHPIEVQIQKNQPQKYIDNQYLFSVSPTSRRWYELMAAKIFGVVKNKGQFCEVRYSWYAQHHHTLKRYSEHKRVRFQMDRIVKDHIASGYISKVEYRAIKEPDKEVDYIIRYYPGEGAKESIARIQGHIYRKRTKNLAAKTAEFHTAPQGGITTSKPPAEQGSEAPAAGTEAVTMALITAEDAENQQMVNQLVGEFGIMAIKALELVKEKREAVALQLAYWQHRNVKPANVAGWIIKAIEANYSAPESFLAKQQEQAQQQQFQKRRAIINQCSFCKQMNGFVYIEKDGLKSVRKCTHDPAIEAPASH